MSKAKKNGVPRRAISIDKYDDLAHFAEKFVQGHFNLLVIVGGPGVGKSQTVKRFIHQKPHCLIKGRTTPFRLYNELYVHKDEPIHLDDADSLWNKPDCRPLIKAVCESEENKVVTWRSKALEDAGVPESFVTKSRVIVTCNEWHTVDEFRAIEDRGIFISFTPSAQELHRHVGDGDWFYDKEVFEFISEHLEFVAEPSIRHYINASDLRRAEIPNWQDKLIGMLSPDIRRIHIIRQLLVDDSFPNEAERVERFVELTGASRATYYRDRDWLLARGNGGGHNNIAVRK